MDGYLAVVGRDANPSGDKPTIQSKQIGIESRDRYSNYAGLR